MSQIREAGPEDMLQLTGLLDEYLQETFQKRWTGSRDALKAAVLHSGISALVAFDDAEMVGFTFWQRAYDVHHTVWGGHLLDLYVQKPLRGGGIAPELLLATIAAVHRTGGHFLRGQGVSEQGDRLYDRFAVTFPGTQFILGGRAFRDLAGLYGLPLREAFRRIPPKSANFEP